MSDLVSYLFQTHAFKICPDEKPFWYTSGKIGPYFINAQFLYGSEKEANEFLEFINQELENSSKLDIPKHIFDRVYNQYQNNNIYQDVMDQMKQFIEDNIDVTEIDYVSGGERRDWYFSNMIAYLLNKPHITIYKDLSTVISTSDFSISKETANLEDKKVLHVADLLNQASSYLRAWIPAIQNLGAEIVWSTVAVDRMQGGTKRLEDLGIKSLAMVEIAPNLFEQAKNQNIINDTQLNMLNDFFANPDDTMKQFLVTHPDFIKNALNSDEKTAKRARLCVENNLYGL